LIVDCNPVTFVQGKVAAIGPQREWYDVQVDPGYDLDPTAIRQSMRPLSILDKNRPELPWKNGVPDLYPSKVEWVAGVPRLLRVHTMLHCRGRYPVQVGDLAVLPAFGACAFTCRGSCDIIFRHCTVYQAGAMAFHEHGGGGNTHMEGCKVMRRPGSGRLLSTNADGFHSKNMRKGPTIEDSLFEGMHDDGVNIHGMFGRVAAGRKQADVLQIVPFFEEPGKPGDTVEFFSTKTGQSLGTRTLRQVRYVGRTDPVRAAAYHHGAGHGLLAEFKLDRPVTLEASDASMNLDCCGRGFIIRRNEFRALRYRGLLIRSLDGVIEDNRIFSVGMAGILLGSDLFSEGPYAQDVHIRSNSISRTGLLPFAHSGWGIAVFQNLDTGTLQLPDVPLNRNILIADNRISDVTRDGIYVRKANHVTLRNNIVTEIGIRPSPNTVAPQAISVE
jgi:parallel beta-helix repeat protein